MARKKTAFDRDLAGWMKRRNDGRPEGEKVGFFGLDVYSLWDSLYQLMAYLRKEDPSALAAARRNRSGR